MQRTRVPVGVLPAIIVNPVGGIGILLDLRNDNALSNRMERTGLDEKDVAFMYLDFVYQFHKGILLNMGPELLLGDRPFKPIHQFCAGLTVQNHPLSGLSIFPFDAQCICIVRMDLHGQVILRVDQLNKMGNAGNACARVQPLSGNVFT